MNVDVIGVMEALGRILIAALFVHHGYHALTKRFSFHTERLRSLHFPLPAATLALGFAMMFGGGALVTLNIYTTVGALLLLVFSIVATVLFQNFWSIKDPDQRAQRRASFMFNLAVIGGILMVIARDQM